MKQFGDNLSDVIAKFAGSWPGIISCVITISLWIVIQRLYPFDVKPYILLNLMLSISAALSGPFIMMAQARKEESSQKELKEILALIKQELKEIKEIKDKVC